MSNPHPNLNNLTRRGLGRPKGSKNKATIAREFAMQATLVSVNEGLAPEVVTKLTPLQVLLGLMHASIASGRLKEGGMWAEKAAPYMHGKIAAVASDGELPPELKADPETRALAPPDPVPEPDEIGPENPIL